MPVFDEPLTLLTPFGLATCTERVDNLQRSYWICWPYETSICFWFLNQEVRYHEDWSDGRYKPVPFTLDPKRIEVLDALGKHHAYWRDNIRPGKPSPAAIHRRRWNRRHGRRARGTSR